MESPGALLSRLREVQGYHWDENTEPFHSSYGECPLVISHWVFLLRYRPRYSFGGFALLCMLCKLTGVPLSSMLASNLSESPVLTTMFRQLALLWNSVYLRR